MNIFRGLEIESDKEIGPKRAFCRGLNMEFFSFAKVKADEKGLWDRLTIGSLPDFCASIDSLFSTRGDEGTMICLWGRFEVHRQLIQGGVRFSLPTCPNALAWTVTTGFPPAPDGVVVHCTINRTEHDPDFIESIEAFVEDWRLGLEEKLSPSGGGSVLKDGSSPEKQPLTPLAMS